MMGEISLTKDSDALICVLYRDYLKKRKSGTAKSDAKWFGSSEFIQRDLIPKWSPEDTDETCRELHRAGLLTCEYADNRVIFCILSDAGIAYMENRFANGLDEVLGYIERIKSILLL